MKIKEQTTYDRISYEAPTVQFRTLDAFIADLDAGRVTTVYHDREESPNGRRWNSTFRAVVANGDNLHVAVLTFSMSVMTVFDERRGSRPADADEQERYQEETHAEMVEFIRGRLEEIGILSLREGRLDIPSWVHSLYARANPVYAKGEPKPPAKVKVAS